MNLSRKQEDLLGQDFYKEVTGECSVGELKHSTQSQLLKTEGNSLNIAPKRPELEPDTLVSSGPLKSNSKDCAESSLCLPTLRLQRPCQQFGGRYQHDCLEDTETSWLAGKDTPTCRAACRLGNATQGPSFGI